MNANQDENRDVNGRCKVCGKPICEDPDDPEFGRCRNGCDPRQSGEAEKEKPPAPARGPEHRSKPKNGRLQAVIAILAIIGAITVLLLSICAGIVFFNR
ncbi:hypothetical protein LJK87_39425 [Paenibacillus sp. P25]|nr:hypothetical protein LJK87_39425 [Paenibacillus sp. P25]